MMCTLPFSFKVLWSPLVEFYQLVPCFGKRKSWLIPAQLIMVFFLFWLATNLEPMLINKEVNIVFYVFTAFIFVITCQDIALDSWAVEILQEENISYASSSQSVGQSIGFFISSSVFMTLSSKDFCSNHLGLKNELWTLEGFLFYYAIFLFTTTIFIAIFVPEEVKSLPLKEKKTRKRHRIAKEREKDGCCDIG